jgi:hypothetical protein
MKLVIDNYFKREENMTRVTRRKQRAVESELLAYKYLCLFVLGFCIGIFIGYTI